MSDDDTAYERHNEGRSTASGSERTRTYRQSVSAVAADRSAQPGIGGLPAIDRILSQVHS